MSEEEEVILVVDEKKTERESHKKGHLVQSYFNKSSELGSCVVARE
jgi:hypothetical protein